MNNSTFYIPPSLLDSYNQLNYRNEVSIEHFLITSLCIIGGLYGRLRNAVNSHGNAVKPKFNLITVGNDLRAFRLNEELFTTIQGQQQLSYEMIKCIDKDKYTNNLNFLRKRLIDIQKEPDSDRTTQIRTLQKMIPFAFAINPMFYQKEPTYKALMKSLERSFDHTLLLNYSQVDLFEKLPNRVVTQTHNKLLDLIIELISGRSIYCKSHQLNLQLNVDIPQVSGIFGALRSSIKSGLDVDNNYRIRYFLKHCLILDYSKANHYKNNYNAPDISGQYPWQNLISKTIHLRKHYIMGSHLENNTIHGYYPEWEDFLDNDFYPQLNEVIKPFFPDYNNLALTLHELLVYSDVSQDTAHYEELRQLAIYLAKYLIIKKKEFISEILLSNKTNNLEKERKRMLGKLSPEPLMFRDLARKYANQRKEHLQPILQSLIDDHYVSIDEKGYIHSKITNIDSGMKVA